MKKDIKLSELVDLALGCPELGVVNFNLLKTLLHKILALTKLSSASFVDESLGFPEQKNEETESNSAGEQRFFEDVGSNKSEKDSTTYNTEKRTLVAGHSHNIKKDGPIENMQQEISRLQEMQDNLAKKVQDLERESGMGILDRFTNNDSLLKNKKSSFKVETHLKSRGDTNEKSYDLRNESILEKDIATSEGNILNSSWQNVRINRRLQTIEEGMEKLFLMLDNLVEEQNTLEKQLNDRGQGISKVDKEPNGLNMDKLLNLEAQLKKVMEEQRVAEDGGSEEIEERLMNLEKQLKQLKVDYRGIENSNVTKPQANNDVDSAFIELGNSIRAEINDLKNSVEELATRKELGDYVKWTALEEALNVRGYVRKNTGENEAVKENKDRSTSVDGSFDDLQTQDGITDKCLEGDFQKANDETAEQEFENVNADQECSPGGHQDQKNPSEEMKECLRRISDVVTLYGDLEMKMDKISAQQDAWLKHSQQEEQASRLYLDELKNQINSTTQIVECNKSHIDTIREELDQIKEDVKNNQGLFDSEELIGGIRGRIMELEDEERDTKIELKHLGNTVLNELRAKQQLIDTLYECVEQLQRNKADVTNATSIFDLEAYQKALDAKVSMSDFDEMMLTLDRNLQDVVQRLEQYSNEEEGLKNALDKITEDMQDKLDSKAAESLKKYLESRINQLQASRENLVSRTGRDILSNAAGFRRPLASLYHCISCDQPVNLSGNVALPTISQRYPKKKIKIPQAVHNKEQGQQGSETDDISTHQVDENGNHGQVELWKDSLSARRPCGGSHTVFPYAVKKPEKNHGFNQSFAPSEISKRIRLNMHGRRREKSIVDFLLGTDGHVYRGRYKKTDLRYSKNNGSTSFDRHALRSRSAEMPRMAQNAAKYRNSSSSVPNSELNSPRSLPPISKDAFLVNTPADSMVSEKAIKTDSKSL